MAKIITIAIREKDEKILAEMKSKNIKISRFVQNALDEFYKSMEDPDLTIEHLRSKCQFWKQRHDEKDEYISKYAPEFYKEMIKELNKQREVKQNV